MELRSLWQQDFSVTIICAFRQRWKKGDVYRQIVRPENGLIYFECCTALYEQPDGPSFLAKPGDFLFLSKNSRYTVRFLDGEPRAVSSLLINFHIQDEKGRDFFPSAPFIPLPAFPREEAEADLRQLNDLYYDASFAPAEMKGLLCQLLARVSRSLDGQRQHSSSSRIAPALDWLERHYHEELSVPALAALCCMSESGFRKRFTEEVGLSPLQYRMERRIQQAKRLMRTASLSVSEVALAVGFEDVNYFCRAFRKATGLSPGAYGKI